MTIDRGKLLVEMFVARFEERGEAYRLLAEHAALADVLTPELVAYLHSQFLGAEVPHYEAGADLLLSELCQEAGYEQYTIEAGAREYLLASIERRPGGAERMKQVARLLLGYLSYVARRKGSIHDRAMESQRLGAMMYLDEERKEAVTALVHRINECFAQPDADAGQAGEEINRAEIARLVRRIEEFAALLKQSGYQRLLEWARDVNAVLNDETGEATRELQQAERLHQSYELPDIEVQLPLIARLAQTPSRRMEETVATPRTRSRRAAVIVGINGYEDAPLRWCVNDATAVFALLGDSGYDREHRRLLTDETQPPPTRESILDSLRAMATASAPEQLLLFYFSGRTWVANDITYIVPGGSSKEFPGKSIPLPEIIREMDLSPARELVIILDGADFGRNPLHPIEWPSKHLTILTSSSPGKMTFDNADSEHGAFTGRLLEALSGQGDLADNEAITTRDVYRYVLEKFTGSKDGQMPAMFSNGEGDAILIERRRDHHRLRDALLGRMENEETDRFVERLGEMTALDVFRLMRRAVIRWDGAAFLIGEDVLPLAGYRNANQTLVRYLLETSERCLAVRLPEFISNRQVDPRELDRMKAAILNRAKAGRPPALTLTGKDHLNLALAAAKELHEEFPDGIMRINAFNRPLDSEATGRNILMPFLPLNLQNYVMPVPLNLATHELFKDKRFLLILENLPANQRIEAYAPPKGSVLIAIRAEEQRPPARGEDRRRALSDRLAKLEKQIEEISDRLYYTVDPAEVARLRAQRESLKRQVEEIEEELELLEARDGDLAMETFNFTTVTLDERGKELKEDGRRTLSARQFVEELVEGVRLEMVEIPGGSFLMGTSEEDFEKIKKEYERYNWDPDWIKREMPRHEVRVSPFFIGKFAVTQAQWRAIAEDKSLKVERDLEPDPSNFKGDDRPVERVSWEDAREFCARLSQKTGREYRLPTEAEWEYACRAGTTTPFAFGETITHETANYGSARPYTKARKRKAREETIAAGSLGVANAFGLYDMHGNVWEWCSDWYGESYYEECHKQGVVTDPKGPGAGSSRVDRGGGWHYNAVDCRSAYRYGNAPGDRSGALGFRLVRVGP